jgi:uncharacterized protein
MPTVTSLCIYPIKSLGGISLNSAELDEYGFKFDRLWMLITPHNGEFITQRQYPSMALFHTALLDGEVSSLNSSQSLLITAPSGNTHSIRIEQNSGQVQTQSQTSVTIWDDVVTAQDEGDESAHFFTRELGVECRLVRVADYTQRTISEKYAPNGDVVHFGDGYPLHIMNEETLRDVNNRINQPDTVIEMNRFRANIILNNSPAYSEDTWSLISIGDNMIDIPKATSRCTVTTIDQSTAQRGKEPLATLATYRKEQNKINLGVYGIHRRKSGRIHVGDEVFIHSLK